MLGKDRKTVVPPPYRHHPDRQGTPIDPPDLVIRDISPEMGRGVFAARAFSEGETVEVAPIILMTEDWHDLPAECRVRVSGWHYLTSYEGEAYAFPLGYGTLFNHRNEPNLRYQGEDIEQTITYIARRDIEAGESCPSTTTSPTVSTTPTSARRGSKRSASSRKSSTEPTARAVPTGAPGEHMKGSSRWRPPPTIES